MAVKSMTQEQWVCFVTVRSHTKEKLAQSKPFESTPNGWNLTIEFAAPNDANSKLQEVVDIMRTETLETDVDCTTEDT